MKWHTTICLLSIAAFATAGLAQDITDVEAKPYGSYADGKVDTVDLATGNVLLNIPLISYPQRGSLPPLTFSVELNNAPYSQTGYDCTKIAPTVNSNGQPVDSNPNYGSVLMNCQVYSSRYDTSPPGAPFQQQNGSEQPFAWQHSPPQPNPVPNCGLPPPQGNGTPCWYENVWVEEYPSYTLPSGVGAYITSSFAGGMVTAQNNVTTEVYNGTPNVIAASYQYSMVDPSGTTHELQSDATNPPVSWNTFHASDGSGYTFVPSNSGTENAWDAYAPADGLGYSDSNADWLGIPSGNPVSVMSGVRLGTLYSPTGIQYADTIQSYPCIGAANCTRLSGTGLPTYGPRALFSTATDPSGNTIKRGPWYWSDYYSLGVVSSDIQSIYSNSSLVPPPDSSHSSGPYYVDSVGRVIPDIITKQTILPSTGTTSIPWNVPGPNGNLVQYVINYGINYNTDATFHPGALPGNPDPSTDIHASGWAITSIQLPNKTWWTFNYSTGDATSSAGDLESVTTPSGGTISYKYAAIPVDTSSLLAAEINSGRCNGVCHAIQSRTETDARLGSPPETTTYTYGVYTPQTGLLPTSICPTITNGSAAASYAYWTTETDPQGNDTVHSFCALGLPAGGGIPVANEYHEVQTLSYQGSAPQPQGATTNAGTLLKTVQTQYETQLDIPTPNLSYHVPGSIFAAPATITTINPNGNTAGSSVTEAKTYSGDINQPIAVTTKIQCGAGVSQGYGVSHDCAAVQSGNYPYPPLSQKVSYLVPTTESIEDASLNVLRSTTTTYEFQSPISPSYTSANLLGLPLVVAVSGAANDAAGVTTYTYDESAYESQQGPYGNLTSKAESHAMVPYRSPTVITTHTAYNSDGMPVTKIDGNGNKTQISYDTTGMFPKEIQRPVTFDASGNYYYHNDFYSYDPTTGSLQSHTDENGQPTNYTYDEMGRILSIQYPDTVNSTHGGSQFCYTDSGNICPQGSTLFALYTKTVATPDPTVTTQHFYDGWGRQYQSTILSDPLGATTVNTTYDWSGRVTSVTNPFRSTCDSTYGVTSYTYDALGRKTIQTQPDGNMQKWCYDGVVTNSLLQNSCLKLSMQYGSYAPTEWTDVWDETGRHTQQVFDALGRMGSVIEPDSSSGSLAMETDYAYDLYGDLMQVNQYGEATSPQVSRLFWYDIPSRVVLSSNPETTAPAPSGQNWINTTTVSYVYDADSNLTSKTDGRGITTTYKYDALNRLLSKTYTNDPTGTASTCYLYDTASQNGSGRLGTQWTQAAACAYPPALPSTGILTKSAISSYDPMGRVLSEQRCMGLASCSSGSYTMSYTYDLAGKLTSYPSGLGALTFANAYDAVGHLLSLTNSSQNTTVFSSPSYTPAGALSGVSLGSSLNMSRAFDSRQRVTSETDSHP